MDMLEKEMANPLHYSCLEKGAWWATVHEGRKEPDMTEQLCVCIYTMGIFSPLKLSTRFL